MRAKSEKADCRIEGCDTPAKSRGWCEKHYMRWYKNGDTSIVHLPGTAKVPVADRIKAKVVIAENGCWHWQGNIDARTGYGKMTILGKGTPAHRASFETFVGPIPAGMHIDHVCHNSDPTCPGQRTCAHRRCVNPKHLEPVTVRENLLRSALTLTSKEAKRTHCPAGHPYNEANTRLNAGSRQCRVCDATRARALRVANHSQPIKETA